MSTLKFSGRISPEDQFHQETSAPSSDAKADEHYIAPTTKHVTITHPPEVKTIGVPQYADTVHGQSGGQYDPAGDCDGYFMSSKYQPNNNCYAYGCNIATNTFPQPGRKSGYKLMPEDFTGTVDQVGKLVRSFAEKDGLKFAGFTHKELKKFKSDEQLNNSGDLPGHFVALMISPAGDDKWRSGRKKWPGDYHWARCNNSAETCDSWSQKDSSDQVTNFDFAGNPISNPREANWTVNQGSQQDIDPETKKIVETDKNDLIVKYEFYCFMFVPNSGVKII